MLRSRIRSKGADAHKEVESSLKHVDNMSEVMIRHEAIIRSSTCHQKADQLLCTTLLAREHGHCEEEAEVYLPVGIRHLSSAGIVSACLNISIAATTNSSSV